MGNVMLAKQPILNQKKEIYAYELLYRGDDPIDQIDGDFATIDVMINAFLNIGINQLTNDYPVFINFSDNLLKEGIVQAFEPNDLIIEILETVELTDEMTHLIKNLSRQGYRLALDDVTVNLYNKWEDANLIQYLAFIKVDFIQNKTRTARKLLASRVKANHPHIRILAEKVESINAYNEAVEDGYHYFQGYFFMRPKLIQSVEISSSYLSHLRLIKQIDQEDFDFKEIAALIEMDLSLAYKLLRLINSPAYRRVGRIYSIHQAVVLLGQKEIKKWLYILALRENYNRNNLEANDALIESSYYRAKMAESIAVKVAPHLINEAFLVGYFSQLPAILRQPIDKLLQALSLDESIERALLNQTGTLTDVLQLVVAYERVSWKEVDYITERLALDQELVFSAYKNAQKWVNHITRN